MGYILFFFCALAAALLFVYLYRESTALSVTEFRIDTDRICTIEYNIVMLSDLHETAHGGDNSRVLEMIDEINPDAVFFAGDMVTAGEGSVPGFSVTLSFIERLRQKYPVYYGLGNHEEKLRQSQGKAGKAYGKYISSLLKLGVNILDNESMSIEEAGIILYGLSLELKYYRKIRDLKLPEGYLENIFGKVNSDRFSVLLAHFPDRFEQYAEWKPDLVLSGHVHGGIVRLPFLGGVISPQLKLFPKYDCGMFHEGSSTMILSRGIGTHTIPLRVNNKAEIVHIILKKSPFTGSDVKAGAEGGLHAGSDR